MEYSVYIATSIDGFIATPDGGIDWLMEYSADAKIKGEFSYEQFISSIDVLIMGRNTFEKVLTFGEWPYEGTPLIVLSTTLTEVPADLQGKAETFNGSLEELDQLLTKREYKRAYIDGGRTVQSFLNEGLVSDLTLTRIPVILGGGISLFGTSDLPIKLNHEKTETNSVGFVMSRYRVIKE